MSYVLNPGFTPGMMAPQTAGAVLLYDASGNAIAYPPVAAGRVLTDNGPGLPPTWQAPSGIPATGTAGSVLIYDASGNAAVLAPATAGKILTANGAGLAPSFQTPRQVTIDPGTTLTATATYTSPSWTVGLYRKIILELECSATAFSYFRFQANADGALTYTDIGFNNNSAIGVDSHVKGTNGFAIVGVAIAAGNNNVCRVEFWPLTNGRTRLGFGHSMSDNNSGTLANSMSRTTEFAYCNTATDITFVTMSVTAATMTGIAKLYGELA